MNRYIELAVFLVFISASSGIAGISTGKMAGAKWVRALARFFMRYFRAPFDKIRFYIIWISYLMILVISALLICIMWKADPFTAVHGGYDGYMRSGFAEIVTVSLAGFIFQFEISSILLLVINAFSKETNWYREISAIGWIRVSSNLPAHIRFLYPASAALVEELYFRGCIYGILAYRFGWLPFPATVFITTTMFILEQALGTQSLKQAVAMGIGSFAISVSGCFMMAMTGTVLPALICHEMYVIFYLRDQSA